MKAFILILGLLITTAPMAGLFDTYEAAVESARPTMTRDQLFFVDEVPTWRYRDPILQSFAAALGMDDVQMIELARTL